jgi:hypothetical protein
MRCGSSMVYEPSVDARYSTCEPSADITCQPTCTWKPPFHIADGAWHTWMSSLLTKACTRSG